MGEQGILVLTCARVHHNATLLRVVGVPEIHHEYETVKVDGTNGDGETLLLNDLPRTGSGYETHSGEMALPSWSKIRS